MINIKTKFENIIVPNGYKTVNMGKQIEVADQQFLTKKQVKNVVIFIKEEIKQAVLADRNRIWEGIRNL